jgi:hypothetical protein
MNDFTFESLRDNGDGCQGARFSRAQASQRDWTPEKCAAAAERERQHKAWLATEEGADWFNRASWNKSIPCVRVRRLGLQQIPTGGYVMLYNRLDNKSTVTLASLVKQGYRIEVVK